MDEELHEANLIRYFGEDHETRIAIVRALAWMPADVRSFAVNECVFTSVGNTTLGVCLDRKSVRASDDDSVQPCGFAAIRPAAAGTRLMLRLGNRSLRG